MESRWPMPCAWFFGEQLVNVVLKELAFLRVLGLVLSRRIDGARPDDVAISYGGRRSSLKLAVGVGFLLFGATTLSQSGDRVLWWVVGLVLIYAGLLTTVVGLASRVRPHLLRSGTPAELSLRWGLGSEVNVPLESVREFTFLSDGTAASQAGEKASVGYRFEAPGGSGPRVVLELLEPVIVPTMLGLTRPAIAVSVPVNDVAAAEALLTAGSR